MAAEALDCSTFLSDSRASGLLYRLFNKISDSRASGLLYRLFNKIIDYLSVCFCS